MLYVWHTSEFGAEIIYWDCDTFERFGAGIELIWNGLVKLQFVYGDAVEGDVDAMLVGLFDSL